MSQADHIAALEQDTPQAVAPVSTIPWRDGALGLAGMTLAWLLVMAIRPHPLIGAWIVLLATAAPMLAAELHRAPAVERRRQGWAPLAFAIGLALAVLPFLLFHTQGSGFYIWLSAWAVVVPAFLLRCVVEWARTGALSGGLPAALGRALLGRDWGGLRALSPSARLWALKAIFIPLYATSLLALVRLGLASQPVTVIDWLTLAVLFAFTVDLAFGLSGYLFASNDVAPTVRSTQPRLIGWLVCLACYGPIFTHWPAFKTVVHAEIGWPRHLELSLSGTLAAAVMLALLVLYVWATVVFGLRFSNLANRGVLAAGPYRLMKHPAYFAHAANAWILCFMLLPAAGIDLGSSQLLVPLAFTVLYWARARTEEVHMREDPDYLAYERWIARHGLLARMLGLARRLVSR